MRMMRTFVFLSLLTVSSLIGCSRQHQNDEVTQEPATLVKIPGSEFNKVILTDDAFKRVGIELTPIKEIQLDTQGNAVIAPNNPILQPQTSVTGLPSNQQLTMKLVPYSAILYGLHGETWVYVLIDHLTFVRAKVTVHHIEGDRAILSAGPSINTQIVSVGAAELYGSEYIGNIEP